jgi:hypothetical protein
VNRCTRHNRLDCWHDQCRSGQTNNNAGDLSIGVNDGDLNVGIGNGMTIDLDTGDIGIEIAPGLSYDF